MLQTTTSRSTTIASSSDIRQYIGSSPSSMPIESSNDVCVDVLFLSLSRSSGIYSRVALLPSNLAIDYTAQRPCMNSHGTFRRFGGLAA